MSQIPILAVRKAEVAHPTGDPKFSVMQPFPSAFSAKEADPFLMCDYFGPTTSTGKETDPDNFPIGWHPHRGMDILTYITQGVGRHADSLGNREEFASPGMQWISVGSGIEHAEGGGTPAGEDMAGFQIWVNVPSEKKMDDPRYGTEPPESIPAITCSDGATCRLLAGSMNGRRGPFMTVQDVQMVDYNLSAGSTVTHSVPPELDNCLVYIYRGDARAADQSLPTHSCVRLNASPTVPSRDFTVTAGPKGVSFLIFAGKMLNQPIAWHGPFVMTTDSEIRRTIMEYHEGKFLKRRAQWDYKRIASKPSEA
mmetsp:Transcript_20579/g.29520  ORF Transcript_20579/g.29520 Transcript_20579/m.29520 type:complete len:310 (+) Transcript_20579:85-1014(+)